MNLKDVSLRSVLNALVVATGARAWSFVPYGDRLQFVSITIG
jgi:hypothetical protein